MKYALVLFVYLIAIISSLF